MSHAILTKARRCVATDAREQSGRWPLKSRVLHLGGMFSGAFCERQLPEETVITDQ